MAYAAADHVALLEEAGGVDQGLSTQKLPETMSDAQTFDDDVDITMKIPIVHPQPEEPPKSA